MRIINGYVMKNLLLTLAMALGILVFVMMGTYFFRLFDMLSKGVSPWLVLRIVLYMLPDVLRYALPFSVMIATVLVFSRMSADNEIVALKASGVSLWQIVAPGLALSAVISLFCLYLAFYLAPDARNASSRLQAEALNNENIAAMLEPGRITELSDKFSIRVGRIEGDVMFDVHCYVFDKDGSAPPLDDITAESGMFVEDTATGGVKLILNNFTGSRLPHLTDETGKGDEDEGTSGNKSDKAARMVSGDIESPYLSASTLVIPFSSGDAAAGMASLARKPKAMNINMLIGNMMLIEKEDTKNLSRHWVELQSRVALALAPFALFILGVPFGIRSRRSETSTGLLICACLGIFFYAFLVLGRTFSGNPSLFPQYIVWIPDILYQIGGLISIHLISRR